jgi:cutinase
MKVFAQSLLPLSLLVSGAFAAPTPQEATGPSFPITDLLNSDLTIAEYTAQLEAQAIAEPKVAKRQYSGDTFNQFTDNSACRAVTLFFARGTTSPGNVGEAGSEGPTFFNAVASRLGTKTLAVQGVNYSASIGGFLAGGDAAGATTLFNLINQAATRCPSTKIVVSGYSQGAQLVHTATQRLSAATAARVSAGKFSIVVFEDLANVAKSLLSETLIGTRHSVSSPRPRSSSSATPATTSVTTVSSSPPSTGTTRWMPLLLRRLSSPRFKRGSRGYPSLADSLSFSRKNPVVAPCMSMRSS